MLLKKLNLLFFIIIIFFINSSITSKDIIKNDELIISGPMASGSKNGQMIIFLQLKNKENVKILYSLKNKNDYLESDSTLEKNDYIYHIYINHLKSYENYDYKLIINNKEIKNNLYFKSPPLSYNENNLNNIKFAFGSCSGIPSTNFNNIKEFYKPFKINSNIYDNITLHNPDFMIHTGDNVYLENSDVYNPNAIQYRYKYCRSLPNLQKLMNSVTTYATIDDHDYSYDNGEFDYPLKDTSIKVFDLYFPQTKDKSINFKGVSNKFIYGDIEFYLIDDRYYKNTEHKIFFGKDQFNWLKEELKKSKIPFKCVVIGSQMFNLSLVGESIYEDFNKESNELFNWIINEKIEGIFFITGDRHYTEICKFQPKNCYPLYDLSVSSLTSTSGNLLTLLPSKYRVNNLVYGKNNFGIIELLGNNLKERKLKLSIYNKDNKFIFDYEIYLNELKFK